MGLIHWWPLNGDLYDRGSNPHHGTIVGAANVTTSGVLGQCLSGMSGSKTTAGVSVANCNLLDEISDEYSAAMWIKVHGTHVHYEGAFISSGNWNNQRWTFGINQANNKIQPLTNASHQNYISLGKTLTNDQWYHVATTYKNGTAYLYLDGALVGSIAATAPYQSSATNLCIGRETYAGGYFSFNGDICDVRVYNHALSKIEVKELSKGLYIHYAFNDAYSEATTNIYSGKSFTGHGSSWTALSEEYSGTPVYRNIVTNPSTGNNAGFRYTTTFSYTQSQATAPYITISFWKRLNEVYGRNLVGYIRVRYTDGVVSTHNWSYNKSNWANDSNSIGRWEYIIGRASLSSGKTIEAITHLYVYTDQATQGNCDFAGIMVEAKDHATPYTPSSRSSMFYDDSGNGNDGIGHQMSLTTSSNCGEYSAVFNGSYSYIELANTKPALPNEPYTILFWINPTENGVRDIIFGNYNDSSQTFNVERHTDNQLRIYYHGDGAIGYVAKATMLANTWTHIAITFDGSTCRVYKNGEEVYSKALSTTLNCTNANWKIGSDYRTAATSTEATRFKGKMNDFRIYVSALSAADVLELYESQAAVDKNNNIFTNEIIEQQHTGNMVNAASWEQNGIGDGSGNDVDDMMTRIRSKYIPVLPGATYYYGVRNSDMEVRGVHYYNASNIWIGYISEGGSQTTPSNCAYVRWVIQNTDKSTSIPVANIATYGPYMVYQGQPTPQGLDEGTEVQVNKDYTITTKDICEGHDSGFFIDGTATGNQFYEI